MSNIDFSTKNRCFNNIIVAHIDALFGLTLDAMIHSEQNISLFVCRCSGNQVKTGLYRGHTEEVRGHCTSQDFTTSPLIETPARSQSTASATSKGLNVLASYLAKINRRLDDMEKNQNEILARLCPTTPAINILPPEVKLPCETLEEVNDLEDWLLDDTNKQSLSIALSLDDSKVQNEPQEIQETRSVRTVGGKVYKSYIGATGNFLMVSYCLLLCILTQLFVSGGDYWITYWVNLEEQNTKTLREQNMPLGNFIKSNLTTNATSELTKSNNNTYVYAEDGELGGGDYLLGTFVRMCVKASMTLHDNMFNSVTRATMKFFNTNSSGIVRKQRNLSNATQDEVNTNISNWFRFSKDRNGGREERRKEKRPRQDSQD